MRIGIDARLWNQTGVGRYIRNLIIQLQKIDCINQYVIFVQSEDAEAVSRHIIAANYQIIKVDIRWHSVNEQLQFPAILYKEDLTIMHFPYFSLPIFYNKPFIVTIHDLIIHHFSTGQASTLPLPVYKIKHLGYKTVIMQAMKRAKKIIVPLNAIKYDVEKIFHVDAKRIMVTPEGVDPAVSNIKYQMSNSELKNQRYFLYVGNAYPHKNLNTLVSAFALLKSKKNNQDVTLTLVGKEDYFYKKLELELNTQSISYVKVLHNVDDVLLHGLYTNALAVVAPSFMEGFGLVPLEAMANNCLVIASDIPAHREVCGDAAIFFDPNNIHDLVNKMEHFLSQHDSSMYQTKKQTGLKMIEMFSWEKMAKETLEIYEQFKK